MIRRICKYIVFKMVYPLVYSLGRLRKVNAGKVLFVENHGDYISNDYQLMYDTLRQRGYEVKMHYLGMSTSSWGTIIQKTIALLWDMSTAQCVFLNESNSVFGAFTVRKSTKIVQLWHACGAFKRWGFSVADKSFGDDQKDLERYSGHRNYDLVSVSGQAVCWAYEEAFGLQNRPDVVKALGVSRTDVYFLKERKQEAFERLKQFDKEIFASKLDGRKIILYAPTFRGDIRGAKSPDKLDLQILSRLADHYVLFVKQHPFVKEQFPIAEEYKNFCVEIDKELSVEELLIVSDICITDYSSIVFEYSLMRRPMLFFAYDMEEYYDERGFYYPYKEFVPGPVVRTTEEIVQQIENIETYDVAMVESFCNRYMQSCDGHSTDRILDYVLD